MRKGITNIELKEETNWIGSIGGVKMTDKPAALATQAILQDFQDVLLLEEFDETIIKKSYDLIHKTFKTLPTFDFAMFASELYSNLVETFGDRHYISINRNGELAESIALQMVKTMSFDDLKKHNPPLIISGKADAVPMVQYIKLEEGELNYYVLIKYEDCIVKKKHDPATNSYEFIATFQYVSQKEVE